MTELPTKWTPKERLRIITSLADRGLSNTPQSAYHLWLCWNVANCSAKTLRNNQDQIKRAMEDII